MLFNREAQVGVRINERPSLGTRKKDGTPLHLVHYISFASVRETCPLGFVFLWGFCFYCTLRHYHKSLRYRLPSRFSRPRRRGYSTVHWYARKQQPNNNLCLALNTGRLLFVRFCNCFEMRSTPVYRSFNVRNTYLYRI